ncbi:MAG: hypothetical protein JWN67_4520, partial [Actinomycetia bacterium]|nr:hypothetical protein [Actinomycetes bacterium]
TKPLPGWTVTKTDTTITWAGGTIAPGEFQEFEISVGPLPAVDELVFKAVQTYDDGTVVRWIDPTPADGTEPDHPAPTLHLVPGSGEGDDEAAATTTTSTVLGATAASASSEEKDDDDGGKVVGAYVLAVVAVALSATALVQGRRKRNGAAGA